MKKVNLNNNDLDYIIKELRKLQFEILTNLYEGKTPEKEIDQKEEEEIELERIIKIFYKAKKKSQRS